MIVICQILETTLKQMQIVYWFYLHIENFMQNYSTNFLIMLTISMKISSWYAYNNCSKIADSLILALTVINKFIYRNSNLFF